jgi:putative ABC transport system ATP-binding protein
MSLVQATNLTKTYRAGDVEVPAIKGADFVIETRFLRRLRRPVGQRQEHAAQHDRLPRPPSSGTLTVLDTDIATLDRRAAADFRGRTSASSSRTSTWCRCSPPTRTSNTR